MKKHIAVLSVLTLILSTLAIAPIASADNGQRDDQPKGKRVAFIGPPVRGK